MQHFSQSRPASSIFFILLLSILLSGSVFAQSELQPGNITGTVLDGTYGEPLIAANVILEGTIMGAATDIDGRFSIGPIEPGSYTVIVRFLGYTAQRIENVAVRQGAETKLNVVLTEENLDLGEEVVVEAEAILNAEGAMLRLRQKATAVSDAISAEAISKSGSSSAADAMSRVTGASVLGGKYVYVRGLGERYSNTQLNGVNLPSADPDKRAFQLDLFPSSLLDNIVTIKTFTPDKPGDFSGGLVDVATRDFPTARTFQFSVKSAYNTQTSFQNDVVGYQSSSTDWLGYDDGQRSIPEIFADGSLQLPTETQARFDPLLADLLDDASHSFEPEMDVSPQTVPFNRGFSFAAGNKALLGDMEVGYSASLTYDQNFSSYSNGEVGRWQLIGANIDDISQLTPLRQFGGSTGYDRKGSVEANLGGLLTVALKPHRNHSISTTYMRTQSGTSEARDISGYWVDLSQGSTFETRVLGYKERALNSLQLKGKHAFTSFSVDWNASYGNNGQIEPDLRYFSNHFTVRERNGESITIYQKPASLYPAPTRFFRDLSETNYNASLDLTIPVSIGANFQGKLKFGGYYLDIVREFRERRFEIREGNGVSYADFEGDNEAFFNTVGILDQTDSGRFIFGNYIADVSSARSNYDGTQTIASGYGMVELPVGDRLRLIGGVRLETTDMETTSEDESLPVGILNNTDWLPSLNLVYQLPGNMNFRFAATRTLARPTFREMAPYATFDFVGDFVLRGNSDLQRTLITNYDFRWEHFVRPGEIIAASLFYKDFQNPIERVIQTSVGNNSIGVQNVDQATVYGVELELRRRLDDISDKLRHFAIGTNASWVYSSVRIPEEELYVIRLVDPAAENSRPLEGQSPYLINADLSYDNLESRTAIGVYFNVFGERLVTVSEGAAPDVFERPRATLDLVASKGIGKRFSIKLSAKNLLDPDFKSSQIFKDVEYIYNSYRKGRSISFSLGYSL